MHVEIDTRSGDEVTKVYLVSTIARDIVREDRGNVLIRDENFYGG